MHLVNGAESRGRDLAASAAHHVMARFPGADDGRSNGQRIRTYDDVRVAIRPAKLEPFSAVYADHHDALVRQGDVIARLGEIGEARNSMRGHKTIYETSIR
jgi:hypothetical protein